MTEETVDTGGKPAAKSVQTAGFSEDLKQLEEHIAAGTFRHESQRAISEHEMPVRSPPTNPQLS